jgi:hypothetical protein
VASDAFGATRKRRRACGALSPARTKEAGARRGEWRAEQQHITSVYGGGEHKQGKGKIVGAYANFN